MSRTKTVNVVVPPGMLGMVSDSAEAGPTYVCGFKDNCLLRDRIKVQDMLVAVDGNAVSTFMMAVRMSKLLVHKV